MTHAPTSRDDIIEGHLVAPCEFSVRPTPGSPTITSMSFRAHVYEIQPPHTSGFPCIYPDGGMTHDERIDLGMGGE